MGGPAAILPFVQTVGQVLGAVGAGKELLGKKEKKPSPSANLAVPEEAPFVPQRPEASALPESLSELSAFSPEQQRSYLATRGVNQGLGTQEIDYYKNLLQRSLIGDNNQVSQNEQFLNPIEGQFFSQKGFNTSDPVSFLKSLR